MRIQSTTRLRIDLLHKGDEIAAVARFAARFGLPMNLGPSRDDNFLAAELERRELALAYADSAASICAQAMADGKSVDDVLAQIRNQIVTNWHIDAETPFDVTARPVEATKS
jgi:hypothetical protein